MENRHPDLSVSLKECEYVSICKTEPVHMLQIIHDSQRIRF